MLKLRHPIVVFMVAVLVVIGIGVGVSAASWSGWGIGPPVPTGVLRDYGPPGLRFKARFPGRVTCERIPPSTVWETPEITCWSGESRVEGFGVTVTKIPSDTSLVLAPPPPGSETVRFGRAHGDRTRIGCIPMKKDGHSDQWCTADLIVTNGTNYWTVEAMETFEWVNTQPMTQFLSSFRPIG
jgi:hypothetical protein